MHIVEQNVTVETALDGDRILRQIERAGRTCWKSEGQATADSAPRFVDMLVHGKGHESVIEHESITVRFICDRGISHEIVRHRIASYSQESTRYCNYGKKGGMRVVQPPFSKLESIDVWTKAMLAAEDAYLQLLALGEKPQIARSVLPTCLATELVMTANLREWRHFLMLRTAKAAHPQIRELAIDLLWKFQRAIPVVFDDIAVELNEAA